MSRLPLDKWAYLHQLTSVFLFVFLIFAAAKSGAELDERQRVEAETRIRGAIAGVKENVVIPTDKYDLKGLINADDRVLAMLEKQLDQLKLQKDAKETAIKSSLQNVQNGIKAGMDKTKLNAMKAAHNKMVDEYDKIIASGKARFAFYEKVRTERNNAADKWNKLYANR